MQSKELQGSQFASLQDSFWERATKTDTCWVWTGPPNKYGYGSVYYKGTHYKAHRIAYALHFGSVTKDMLVRHTCDNRLCVNPKHLVLGSHLDNAQDRERRGRNGAPKGSASHLTKLTEKDVLVIRWLKKQNISLVSIAKLYHVSKGCIWGIVNHRTWKHVPEELGHVEEDKTQFEVLIQVVEISRKHYTLVVPANSMLEANKLAYDMSVSAITSKGNHMKAYNEREKVFQVINIIDPNQEQTNVD